MPPARTKRTRAPRAKRTPASSANRVAVRKSKNESSPKELFPKVSSRKEDSVFRFLELPGEIRNNVYKYTADWNDALKHLHMEVYGEEFFNHLEEVHQNRSTPKILLLNRQITAEASHVLEQKPLVFSFDPLHYWRCKTCLTYTISETTLERIPKIIVILPASMQGKSDQYHFLRPVERLWEAWSKKLTLQSLSIQLEGVATYAFEVSAALIRQLKSMCYWSLSDFSVQQLIENGLKKHISSVTYAMASINVTENRAEDQTEEERGDRTEDGTED